ncbi:MAG: hypothetical protein ACI39R_07615 [Lachnospiraceae bacterium]
MKERKHKRKSWKEIYTTLVNHIKRDKKAFVVFAVMRTLIILVLVRSAMLRQFESCLICLLALVLLFIPPFVEINFKIDLPTPMEIVVYVFVFCAEILGEIECYYVKYSIWDTMLHTVNGFMFAAFGFCLVDILNRNHKIRFKLSAGYLAIVAFCFSMTIGILWEFVEYGVDHTIRFDMQKDTIITEISSVALDETNSNIAIKVKNIDRTIIECADGTQVVVEGGYLDVGINDTMKDLFVNFVGAVIFSALGYVYVKHHGKGFIASSFIPQPLVEEEKAEPSNL